MKTLFALAVAGLALAIGAPAAQAEDCMLMPVGSLPMTIDAQGNITVPVEIDGKDYRMAVDLGDPDTGIRADIAAQLNLHPESFAKHAATVYRGTLVHSQVIVPELKYGLLTGNQVPVLLLPEGTPLPAGTVGVLGSQLLSNSDVELDFAANKLNLFSKQHCPGAAVYWADSAAAVPFTYGEDGRVLFDMQIDGQPVRVALSGGAESAMRMTAGRRLAGGSLRPASIDPEGDTVYRAPFRTLSMGGIAFNHPAIVVVDDEARLGCNKAAKPPVCFDRADLDLSTAQLKSLHLYFAFNEKTLYATAANAHK